MINSAMPSVELLNKYKTEIAGLRHELSKGVDERVRAPSLARALMLLHLKVAPFCSPQHYGRTTMQDRRQPLIRARMFTFAV